MESAAGCGARTLLFTLLVNEIQSTNEIENIHSTRQEVVEALEAAGRKNRTADRRAPKRFVEMADTFRFLPTDAEPERHSFPQTLPELQFFSYLSVSEQSSLTSKSTLL